MSGMSGVTFVLCGRDSSPRIVACVESASPTSLNEIDLHSAMSLLQLLYDCLLYFTSFGAVLTMFASALTIVFWSLARIVRWLTGEPQTESGVRDQMYLHHADHLKRAGQ